MLSDAAATAVGTAAPMAPTAAGGPCGAAAQVEAINVNPGKRPVAVPVQWNRGALFPIGSKGTVSLLGCTFLLPQPECMLTVSLPNLPIGCKTHA